MIKAAIKNLKKFKRDIRAFDKHQKKAYIDAVKIESYRLRTQLRNEYQEGMAHWPHMREISKISRAYQLAWGAIPPTARKSAIRTYPGSGIAPPGEDAPATYGLAVPIRYKVTTKENKTLAEIGFVGKISKSWKRIAWKQQEGFSVPLTEELRAYFRDAGLRMRGRPIVFSKETKRLSIPGRESIRPFWRANKQKAWENIKAVYERKMRKERVYTSEGEYI